MSTHTLGDKKITIRKIEKGDKKMGFKIVAKIPDQIQWKRKLIDEYIMMKYL